MGGGLVTSGSQSPTWRNPRARWVVRWRAVRSWGAAWASMRYRSRCRGGAQDGTYRRSATQQSLVLAYALSAGCWVREMKRSIRGQYLVGHGLLRFACLKIVEVNAFDIDRLRYPDTHVEPNHQIG